MKRIPVLLTTVVLASAICLSFVIESGGAANTSNGLSHESTLGQRSHKTRDLFASLNLWNMGLNSPASPVTNDKIVFESGLSIFVVEADGANRTNLSTPRAGNDNNPVWSPDGSRIA